MTLPVVDSWALQGVDGPTYKVGPGCANPTCSKFADHAHHLVRRSQIGGDYAWVEIDGKKYGNLVGLCADCHEMITGRIGGHRAAIRLYLEGGAYGGPNLFYWCGISERDGEISYVPLAPLSAQPPTPDALAEHASHRVDESEPCPFCGREGKRRRRPALPRVGRRRRKSWSILVPDDQEDGAEVLDILVDDLAPLLGVEANRTGRYFVIVPTLYYAQQNRADFTRSIRGEG